MADINIGGTLHSTATGNVVARANEILDNTNYPEGKKQSVVNQETNETLGLHTSIIQGLNSQNYVTVESYSDLPDTGQVDTIYRVSSWDGEQEDDTKYCEYAWYDGDYVPLSIKSQVNEVFDISAHTNNTSYASLTAALGVNGGNVPAGIRRGGMSIKYIDSTSSEYVQWRYMATGVTDANITTIANWQGVDEELTAGSKNLVESGRVYADVKLNKNLFELLNTYLVNKYVNSSGVLSSNSNWYMSPFIPVKNGDKFWYRLRGRDNAYPIVFSTDGGTTFDLTNSVQIDSSGNTYMDGVYTVVADGYVSVSYYGSVTDVYLRYLGNFEAYLSNTSKVMFANNSSVTIEEDGASPYAIYITAIYLNTSPNGYRVKSLSDLLSKLGRSTYDTAPSGADGIKIPRYSCLAFNIESKQYHIVNWEGNWKNINFLETVIIANEYGSVSYAVPCINPIKVNLIPDKGIPTGKLADSSITTTKFADNSITTSKIGDGQVTTAKIAAANVTPDKLSKQYNDALFTADANANAVIRKLFIDKTNYTGSVSLNGLSIRSIIRNISSSWSVQFKTTEATLMSITMGSEDDFTYAYWNGLFIYIEFNWSGLADGTRILNNNGIALTADCYNTIYDPRQQFSIIKHTIPKLEQDITDLIPFVVGGVISNAIDYVAETRSVISTPIPCNIGNSVLKVYNDAKTGDNIVTIAIAGRKSNGYVEYIYGFNTYDKEQSLVSSEYDEVFVLIRRLANERTGVKDIQGKYRIEIQQNQIGSDSIADEAVTPIKCNDIVASYMQDEFNASKNKVQSVMKFGESVNVLLMTDIHTNPSDSNVATIAAKRTFDTMSLFSKEIPCNFTALLGDYVAAFTPDTKEGGIRIIENTNKWLSEVDSPKVAIAGNHEAQWGSQSVYGLSLSEFMASMMTKYLINTECLLDYIRDVQDSTKDISIVHYDDNISKIRYIFLSSFNVSALGDTDNLSEIISVASSTPQDYDVIIFSHYGINVWSSGGYANPSVYSDVAAVISAVKQALANGSSLIVWLSGHIHAENVLVSNDVPVIGLLASKFGIMEGPSQDGITYSKTMGSVTEQTFTCMTVRKDLGKLYLTRCGCGTDIEVNYNNTGGQTIGRVWNSLSGIVYDTDGTTPLEGAIVNIEFLGANYTTTSGADGSYSFNKLPNEAGVIKTSLEGYTFADITINVTGTMTQDIQAE